MEHAKLTARAPSAPPPRGRDVAQSLDLVAEDDVVALTGWSPATLLSYRKRRKGPPWVRLGQHYFYPKDSLLEWIAQRIKMPSTVDARTVL